MRHQVVYLHPGSLFPEHEVKDIERRDPALAAERAPASAFAFTFYDVEDAPDLGPDFKVTPVAKNRTGRYYLGGRLYDQASVEAMPDAHILASNMRSNGYQLVIQARTGNWQPFTAADHIVAAS